VPDAQLQIAVGADPKRRHGRAETRILWTIASPALNGYLGSAGVVGAAWPGVQQIGRLQRIVRQTRRGVEHTSSEVHYFITSMPVTRASASELLVRKRAHWAIESLHWIRDVTFGEDASQIHQGQAPEVFALVRNAALSLLRWTGADTLVVAQRDLGIRPAALLALFSNLALRLVK
jgi:predicted transposase YbfD/YdcC